MITIQGKADCARCKHNPKVYQPSTEEETEWIRCDKFNAVPSGIIAGKQKCVEYEKDKTGVIIAQQRERG